MAEDRLDLVVRGAQEVVTRDELERLLDRGGRPKAYIGYEPSGLMHVGQGVITARKILELSRAGFDVTVLLADWHAMINDKFGGNLEAIQKCGRYFEDCFRALGVPESTRYVLASDLVATPGYWMDVLRASKAASVARIRRALTIMGRKESDADLDASKLIYPAMQVVDIHVLDLDLALGGMDQRHAHVLYRDLAPKLKWKSVVALHTPLIAGLRGGSGRMDTSVEAKMSKSKPDEAILLHESPDEIARKMAGAFCPPKETERNPVVELVEHVVFRTRSTFVVDREPKFGGTVEFRSIGDVRRAYRVGDLHPKDLKSATARSLADILAPVREYFRNHPDNLAATAALVPR